MGIIDISCIIFRAHAPKLTPFLSQQALALTK